MGSMFWASLAGARADSLQDWMNYATEQENRANALEQNNHRLQRILGQWQEEAVRADANGVVALNTFKEVNGKSVREHLGDEEIDRRIAEEKNLSRQHYGLK